VWSFIKEWAKCEMGVKWGNQTSSPHEYLQYTVPGKRAAYSRTQRQ
jgi:hypothetical protein